MSYWEKRQEATYKAGELTVNQYFIRLEKAFNQAKRDLQKTVASFYWQYAEENGLTFAEAQKRLNMAEIGELKDYIDLVMQNIGKYNQDVNNMSIKARMTRYQALEAQVDAILRQLYAVDYQANAEKMMRDVYTDTYHRVWYDADRYRGFHAEFAQIEPRTIETLLKYPFNGADFSARLWKQKEHLQSQLMESLTTMMVQGTAPQNLAKDFAKKMQAKKFDAYRLLHTESSYVMSEAAHAGYREDGVERYQILATLDNKTCGICGEQDGKVYLVSEAVTGKNMPPFHPFCRCTDVPHYPDTPAEGEKRAARDSDDNSIEVTADMTYAEWKRKYVDKQESKDVQRQKHPPGWRRQFMNPSVAKKSWREQYAEVEAKEKDAKERLDSLTRESKEWELKYFESFDKDGVANEDYAEKFLSYEPEIDSLTSQLEKIQAEKRGYVKKCVEETEKSMVESGIAENVKMSEKMTVESMDTVKASLKEMVVEGGLPPLKGVRYSPAFVEKYGGKDVVAFYNWQDKTMYLGELLTDPEAYREYRKIAEQSFQDFHAKNIPAWKIGVEDFEKEIKSESDSLRRRYLMKMKNDTLAELATERNLVVEDAKDAIIHEYGHHLHNTVSPKENIFGAKELKSRKFADTFEWGQSHEGKVIAAKVSNYAAESPLEAFAESFVAYQKGEDIPDSLRNVVEGAIKEVGGKIKPSIAKHGVSGTMKMNLQTFANVPKEKLVNYALNPTHPVGKEKARAFKSALGYTQENSEDLRQKILGLFSEDKMVLKYEGEYGKQYEQIMKITGPNGKTASVLTAWIKENDSSEPRLVTLYVTDKEGE